MAITILKGTIISAPSLGKLDITEGGYLVAEEGRIVGTFPQLPAKYAHHPVEDYGNALILQTFSDMHVHGPQYPMVGMGMDLELLDWLNTYAFPTEARFADPEFARAAYRQMAQELIANGTTRVCMFSSLHRKATLILMEELENAGITGYVGKVNMDRNSIPILSETTQESMDETLRWLEECARFEHIKPILTPRFTPSCTDELMAFLGKTMQERNLPMQSHLSENRSEMAWVRELHPDCEQYWETYAKYGMWNERTLMAHCVWCDERERKAMKDSGVIVVHCADSNTNICSGFAPVRQMLNEGLTVTLGSDFAGGSHTSPFDVVADSIRTSKIRTVIDETHPDFLTVSEGWYLAVSAPAAFFGEQPGFSPGNTLHAMVLDDSLYVQAHSLTPTERFERAIYRRQPDAIRAVYSNGRKVFTPDI